MLTKILIFITFFLNLELYLALEKENVKVLNKVCLLLPMQGPCRAGLNMYFFIPSNSTCGTFTWGGCQGNGNRFDTKEECEETCLTPVNKPGGVITLRPKYCELSFDFGFCFGQVKRFYFDRLWKVCKETIYSGCGGNRNNFYTREKCENTCQYTHRKLKS